MKLALITDTHAGIRNDSIAFHDKSKLFYDNVFFPYLKDNHITTVVHLGDLVDRRKYINYYTANRLQTDLLGPMNEMGLDVTFIAGNHDCFYKSTNEVNCLQELVTHYENFVIYDMDAMECYLDGLYVLMIPWICDENRERILARIQSSDAKVAFGHLELKGFEMFKGIISPHGDDAFLFKKFDMVCSGHFHHKSSVGNIHYLGSHAQFTWNDCDDPRGFHVLDTNSLKLTFIENPYRMFRKFYYDDAGAYRSDDVKEYELENCMVKVVVGVKKNPQLFEKYIIDIEKQNPLSLQILDDGGFQTKFEAYDVKDAQDTLTFCYQYIDSLELKDINKRELKVLIADLYSAV